MSELDSKIPHRVTCLPRPSLQYMPPLFCKSCIQLFGKLGEEIQGNLHSEYPIACSGCGEYLSYIPTDSCLDLVYRLIVDLINGKKPEQRIVYSQPRSLPYQKLILEIVSPYANLYKSERGKVVSRFIEWVQNPINFYEKENAKETPNYKTGNAEEAEKI